MAGPTRERFGLWQTVWTRRRRCAADGTRDRVLAEADAAGQVDWVASVGATIARAHKHATHTTRPAQGKGARASHRNLPIDAREPPGHGIGRSRGGLTTKIHAVVDGRGRPLAAVVTGGHRNDGALLEAVLGDIRVPRLGGGCPRTRPDAVIIDKANSAGTYRRALHARGITVVMPEKSDQIAARKRRGRRGGRPPGHGASAYRRRNVVERHFALTKHWRGLATRYDMLAITDSAAGIPAACLTWTRIGET